MLISDFDVLNLPVALLVRMGEHHQRLLGVQLDKLSVQNGSYG